MPANWFPTHSGKRISTDAPDPDLFEIDDIAHSLSNQPRYNGHTNRPFSVAQHSVLVERCVSRRFGVTDKAMLRTALLHDAGEFVTGDMVYPLKHMLQKLDNFLQSLRAVVPLDPELEDLVTFHEIERRAEAAMASRFDLIWPFPSEIHRADSAVTAAEKEHLFDHDYPEWVIDAEPYPKTAGFICWSPAQAKTAFLMRCKELGVA